jgi:hypothetical protein
MSDDGRRYLILTANYCKERTRRSQHLAELSNCTRDESDGRECISLEEGAEFREKFVVFLKFHRLVVSRASLGLSGEQPFLLAKSIGLERKIIQEIVDCTSL